MKGSVEFMGPGYMWRALENHVPEIKEQIEVLKPCSDRKVIFRLFMITLKLRWRKTF